MQAGEGVLRERVAAFGRAVGTTWRPRRSPAARRGPVRTANRGRNGRWFRRGRRGRDAGAGSWSSGVASSSSDYDAATWALRTSGPRRCAARELRRSTSLCAPNRSTIMRRSSRLAKTFGIPVGGSRGRWRGPCGPMGQRVARGTSRPGSRQRHLSHNVYYVKLRRWLPKSSICARRPPLSRQAAGTTSSDRATRRDAGPTCSRVTHQKTARSGPAPHAPWHQGSPHSDRASTPELKGIPMIDAAAELASNPSRCRCGVSTETKASLALACAALLWSGNFIAGRALRDDIAPTTLNLLRWSLCLLLLAPWVAARCWRHRRVVAREWRLVVAQKLEDGPSDEAAHDLDPHEHQQEADEIGDPMMADIGQQESAG